MLTLYCGLGVVRMPLQDWVFSVRLGFQGDDTWRCYGALLGLGQERWLLCNYRPHLLTLMLLLHDCSKRNRCGPAQLLVGDAIIYICP